MLFHNVGQRQATCSDKTTGNKQLWINHYFRQVHAYGMRSPRAYENT